VVGSGLGEGLGGETFWVRVRRNGFEGLSVGSMGNKAISKEARRAAREAAAAAQAELARRTRANVEDLARFFSARERADGVDEWFAERLQALREQAAQRRGEQRVQCGLALRAMRDRGESLREVARMAGVAEKTARELIREADAATDVTEAVPPAPEAGGPAGPPEGVWQTEEAELAGTSGERLQAALRV
jgi:hypothetical protein